MAKILSPRIINLSLPLLSLSSNHTKQSLSSTTFSRPMSKALFTGNHLTGSAIAPKAYSTASASVVQDDIADVLGEIGIFTATGEPVKFNDLWDQKEGIAVVALLRHFGCFCSWELAESLRESKERFDSAGVKLIAVGVGTPDKAQLLAERLPFPMEILYADPERKAYDVLGLYYGIRRTFFNPASIKVFSRRDAVKKAMKNYTIKATPEDRSSVLQQGGMFVFKGKELIYARKDEGTGDHAPLDDIFEICCKVSAV